MYMYIYVFTFRILDLIVNGKVCLPRGKFTNEPISGSLTPDWRKEGVAPSIETTSATIPAVCLLKRGSM